jgi:hypothetical protein
MAESCVSCPRHPRGHLFQQCMPPGPINLFYQHPLVLIAANSNIDPIVVCSEPFDRQGGRWTCLLNIGWSFHWLWSTLKHWYSPILHRTHCRRVGWSWSRSECRGSKVYPRLCGYSSMSRNMIMLWLSSRLATRERKMGGKWERGRPLFHQFARVIYWSGWLKCVLLRHQSP